jgi:hypothetical protein
MKKPLSFGLFLPVIAVSLLPATAGAIVITATQDAQSLINALVGGGGSGIVVTSATLNGQSQSVDFGVPGTPPGTMVSSGTYTNASGTYGIGNGVVLSSGGVTGLSIEGFGQVLPGYGDGPNSDSANGWPFGSSFPPSTDPGDPSAAGVPASAEQEALLDPITDRPDLDPPETYDHYDVTELVIHFDMQPGLDRVAFNVVFGSEEYPEFVESPYIDGFGMFLNNVNVAFVGGAPVNIRHPDMAAIDGTELDAVLAPGGNPLLTFSGAVNPTGNTLRFIVADTSDGILDTTVYFSNLGGVPEVPVPPAAWLAATAVAACLPRLRRRRGPRAVLVWRPAGGEGAGGGVRRHHHRWRHQWRRHRARRRRPRPRRLPRRAG